MFQRFAIYYGLCTHIDFDVHYIGKLHLGILMSQPNIYKRQESYTRPIYLSTHLGLEYNKVCYVFGLAYHQVSSVFVCCVSLDKWTTSTIEHSNHHWKLERTLLN